METPEQCVKSAQLKINNKDTRMTSGVFIVNFEQISPIILLFLLLTLNK